MNTDTITIKYDWKPSSMAHLGCQRDGAMCENIEWSQERGTVETWRIGKFDPSIYPMLEKTPFQICQNVNMEAPNA